MLFIVARCQHHHWLRFGLWLCVLDDFVLLMVATCNLAFCVIARGVLPLRAHFVSFGFLFLLSFRSLFLYLLWPAFFPQEAKENAWLRVLISSATPHTIFHLQQKRETYNFIGIKSKCPTGFGCLFVWPASDPEKKTRRMLARLISCALTSVIQRERERERDKFRDSVFCGLPISSCVVILSETAALTTGDCPKFVHSFVKQKLESVFAWIPTATMPSPRLRLQLINQQSPTNAAKVAQAPKNPKTQVWT